MWNDLNNIWAVVFIDTSPSYKVEKHENIWFAIAYIIYVRFFVTELWAKM